MYKIFFSGGTTNYHVTISEIFRWRIKKKGLFSSGWCFGEWVSSVFLVTCNFGWTCSTSDELFFFCLFFGWEPSKHPICTASSIIRVLMEWRSRWRSPLPNLRWSNNSQHGAAQRSRKILKIKKWAGVCWGQRHRPAAFTKAGRPVVPLWR